MQITTAAIFLFAAMGAVATPVESNLDSIDVRDGGDARITYTGTCNRAKNECNYKSQNGQSTFIKCGSAANRKCINDGKKCTYDSVSKVVDCD